MADLRRYKSEDGYDVYMTRDMREHLGKFATHLADFSERNFIILSRNDVFDTPDLPGVRTQQETVHSRNLVDSFLKQEKIEITSEGDRNHDRTVISLTDSFERTFSYRAHLSDFQIKGAPADVIVIEEPGTSPAEILAMLSGLAEIKSSPAFEGADEKTLLAFIVGHEAGHLEAKSNPGLSGLGNTAAETFADHRGIEFSAYLQKQGFKLSEETIEMLKSARSLGAMHLYERDGDGLLISDERYIDIIKQAKEGTHATGIFLRNDNTANPTHSEVGRVSPVLRELLYGVIGNMYRGEYERLIATDALAAALVDDKRSLVWSHKPNDPNFILDVNKEDFDDQDLVLGWRISQAYPDIHYAVTQSMIDSGVIDNIPEAKAILEDYTFAFRSLVPEYVEPSLREGIDREMARAKQQLDEHEQAKTEATNPEPDVVSRQPVPAPATPGT